MEDLYKYERELNKQGINIIGGVDEVGRGPLIGSVITACVVLPKNFELEGLTDSKKLSEKKRDKFYEIIMKEALAIGIGECTEKEIDKYNIYEATKIAMKRAIEMASKKAKIEHVLIDAMPLDIDIPTTSIIKGDSKSISIAAASVIAKVTRDKMMYELDKKYPMYDLAHNKGYPTKKHLQAIEKYGITKYHRLSYKPVLDYKDKINELDQILIKRKILEVFSKDIISSGLVSYCLDNLVVEKLDINMTLGNHEVYKICHCGDAQTEITEDGILFLFPGSGIVDHFHPKEVGISEVYSVMGKNKITWRDKSYEIQKCKLGDMHGIDVNDTARIVHYKKTNELLNSKAK